jgi:predicted alpha/beta hydrolase family esterase
MAPSFLILPGINDSGPEHWQSLWERALPAARRVKQADWDRPACPDWVATLGRAVNDAPGDVVLVAHSLGCLVVAHAVAMRALTPAVRGALLVAPPDPDARSFPDVATGFRPLPLQRLPFPSVLVASQDDPYSSMEFSTRVAEAWGSRFVNAGRAGHLNAASGLQDWPAGRAHLDELLATCLRR